MKTARTLLIIGGLVLALVVANNSIRFYQEIVDDGEEILLELRPVDPRSLIQGDYMVLAYAAAAFPPAETRGELPHRGSFVMSVDENGVASFARLYEGGQPGANEVRLRFSHRSKFRDPRLGAESFYFQEGQGEFFASARYGVLRVDERGLSVLVGLADADFALMMPPSEE